MGGNWLQTTDTIFTIILSGVGLYLAYNLRRQLQLKIVDRRLESYASLWALMEVAGPWRIEAGLNPISVLERKELFDNMTNWYFGSGNGMMLAPTTRELYLNAKFNLICDDEKLRPDTLIAFRPDDPHDRERWRGQMSMSQLSLLRAQMRYDLAIFGLLYQTDAFKSGEEEFLEEAGVNLRRRPWKSRAPAAGTRTSRRGFRGLA